ncbi:hypothetical protein JW979_15340 [bacterium]|nr:hypothetical protein [candidate division CSSED10-310 bacterium]
MRNLICRRVYKANIALTHPDAPFDFYDPQNPIYTRSRFLPPSWIDDCALNRVVIADGCRMLDAHIEESVIGLRSVVRPGSILKRVVMMGADFYESESEKSYNRSRGFPLIGIGKNTRIEKAIIDKNARIGNNVIIRDHSNSDNFETPLYAIVDGIVVIPKNSVIFDGTNI